MKKLFDRLARCVLAPLLALVCLHGAQALSETEGHCRALLIACDEFLSAADTESIAHNNLLTMQQVLARDVRGYEIYRQDGMTNSVDALRAAVRWAFADATEEDVSLLYISTHGEFVSNINNPEGVLLLSDGALEERVSAQQLQAILDEVPGVKVLIVDACHSGALIGKGISPATGSERVVSGFRSDDYRVLTSSGGSELSWYWLARLETAPPGSSYFTTALGQGAGIGGEAAADANRDGTITLTEMYEYLWYSQASSTVQTWPQDSDFPLLMYDVDAEEAAEPDELTGIVFHDVGLNPQTAEATLSFTVSRAARVAYRLTYWQDGQWAWSEAVTLLDRSEWDGEGTPEGWMAEGRKEITLALAEYLPEDWTYAMLHLMTLGDGTQESRSAIFASRVLYAVREGDPQLSVETAQRWERAYQPELEIFVGHALPVRLSVIIRDEAGETVRRLCVSSPTRPQGLTPEGSLLYWNGLLHDGTPAPAGCYQVVAVAGTGQERYEAETWVSVE